jgi:hypothetical protein
METYTYIYSKEIMQSFYAEAFDGDYALRPYEAWFICASARNKELTDKERIAAGIGGAEIYKSELVKKHGFEYYYSHVCRFECNINGYASKRTNIPYPPKTTALYATVNPISVKKAFMLRLKQEQELIETMMNSADPNDPGILNMLHKFLGVSNAISTKAISRKNWLDYDIDLTEPLTLDDISSLTQEAIKNINPKENRKYIIVKTKGGFHLLVSTKDLTFNPNVFYNALCSTFTKYSKEIEKTNSDSIPLPGTIQRGYEVTFKVI